MDGKMTFLPKPICRCKAVPVTIPAELPVEIDQLTLKLCGKAGDLKYLKQLSERTKLENFPTP